MATLKAHQVPELLHLHPANPKPHIAEHAILQCLPYIGEYQLRGIPSPCEGKGADSVLVDLTSNLKLFPYA